MKVSNPAVQAYERSTTSSTGATNSASPASAGQMAKAAPATDPAQVSISAEGIALASASSVYNEAKVSDIKSKIANGTYSIDPQQIAERMIDQSA